MGRGRGKGKGRGGGRKMFIANEDELALRDRSVAETLRQRESRRGAEDDEDDDDDEEEVVDKDDSGITFERAPALSEAVDAVAAEDTTDETRPKGLLAGVSGTANPNAINKATKQIKMKDMKDLEDLNPEEGLSRREREALEAERKKAEYMKRHLAGETEQAKRDLERLAIIKARREEARLKREAEGRKPGMSKYGLEDKEEEEEDDDDDDDDDEDGEAEEPQKGSASGGLLPPPPPTAAAAAAAAAAIKAENAKRKAAAGDEPAAATSDGGPPKLKAMDIKKMNPDALKDNLKARGLDIQGQKKDLLKRLLDYEAARS